jgi:hypothetical protein
VERAATQEAPPSGSAWSRDVKGLASDVYKFAHGHGAADVCRQLQNVASRMSGEATIAVIGERSRGKSSLINALLGDGDLLPVDYDVTTNAYISVRRLPPGEQEPFALVHFLQPRREPLRIPVRTLREYASEDGNPDNEKGVRAVEVFHPHPLISEGIRFLDTPGVGGLIGAHGDIALEAVAMADAVLMVLDATQPISVSEIKFLERAAERSGPVVFALAKSDLATGAEEVRSFAREALAKEAADFADAPMLTASAFLALKATKVVDEDAEYARDLEEDSGLLELVTALRRDVLAKVAADRAGAMLDQVRISIAQLAAPDRELMAAAEGRIDPDEQLRRLQAELDRIAPRQGPNGSRRGIREVVNKKFTSPRRELQQELILDNPEGELRAAQDEMLRRVAANWSKRFGKGRRYNRKLPGELETEITAVWTRLNGRLNEHATKIAVELATDYRLAEIEAPPGGEDSPGAGSLPERASPGEGPDVDTGKRTLRLVKIAVGFISIIGAPLGLYYLLQDREELRKANLPKAKEWVNKRFRDARYVLTTELDERVRIAQNRTAEGLEPRHHARVRDLATRVGSLRQFERGGPVDEAKQRLAELRPLEVRADELARSA